MKFTIGEREWTRMLMLGGAAGIAVFLSGFAFPVYTDQARATALKLGACNDKGVIPGWHEQLHALDTLRHPLMQSGLSILLATLTIWALGRMYMGAGRLGLRTPAKRGTFFALGLGVLGLSWFSQMVSLVIDSNRGEFPWCADSVGIPIIALTTAYLMLGATCIGVGAVLAAFLRELPQPLGVWRRERQAVSLAISLPFAVIGLAITALGIVSAPGPAFIGTPAAVVALYLVEATRSGLVSSLQGAEQAA